MITVYKLTDSKGQTFNNTQWGEGISHTARGNGEMCSDAYLHAYLNPLIAEFCNPIHSGFQGDKLLWECESSIPERNDGLKVGIVYLKTIKKIDCPKFTPNQRVYAAIRLARLKLNLSKNWNQWAENWISGKDRSAAAARVAAVVARAAAAMACGKVARVAAWVAEIMAEAVTVEAVAEASAWAVEAAAEVAQSQNKDKNSIDEFTKIFIEILEDARKFEV